MGEMITKPDTNPILIGVLNLFLGALGYLIMGQTKKAIISAVIVMVTSMCFGLGAIWVLISAYDAYLLATKLSQGESIGETENGLSFLDNIYR